MEHRSPRIRSLLRQADRVADAGKRAAAVKLYRQIIEEAPDTAAAWAGLGQVLNAPADKESSYQHALELDPDNAKAGAGLAHLLGEVAPAVQDEEAAGLEDVPNNGGTGTATTAAEMTSFDPVTESEYEVIEAAQEHPLTADEHDHLVVTAAENEGILYCANHPNRETSLRCNRCNKPICSSCANRTPVGYRCPECIREHEDKFFSATVLDYVVVVIVALPLSLIAGWIATFLGIFSIFLGAAAGSLIGRLAFRAAGRRRGRWMPQLIGVIVVIGAVIAWFIFSGRFGFQLIWTGIYIVAASGAAYYQMREAAAIVAISIHVTGHAHRTLYSELCNHRRTEADI